ncbi:ABC transporter permease [Pedobacter caeni]|uniref:ABC-type transport system, involved in lipoprotein release, permease component n=1 Tax=Pedobacter caeni TaxID=288992 RepID=A0A1M4VE22_9SPHI|nr:ABC transporter permease [Pedobacter caeni]SHE67175.1 ABC-type transport system, involved in lipoprotein release, permease component [Pedobacter caeni]
MFRLNLKIALRNILRNKTSSVINIIGLAIGLASCLLLLLYVNYEWNFDKGFKDADKVYQVMTNYQDASGKITGTGGSPGNGIAGEIRKRVPEVDAVTRIAGGGETLIANGRTGFKRVEIFADPEILKIYNYEFIAGNPATALDVPNSVVVTEQTAKLLFGGVNVLNKSIKYKNERDLTITGVIKDFPGNTSIKFDYVMPWSFFEMINERAKNWNWGSFSWLAMVKVNDPSKVDLINSKIKGIFNERSPDGKTENFLFPLAKKHLYNKFVNGKNDGGDIERIYLFIGLAFGILLIACINFMNMATAKSERRAKEVGIKKTIGATRASLVIQFLTEAMVLTLGSVLVAVTIVELTLPMFNNLLSIEIAIDYGNIWYWLVIFGVVMGTGLLSGLYPALFLSAFNPIQTLKRKTARAKSVPVNLRQVLVVCQFCFAIMLIIATLVIYKQISFIKNRPIGYHANLLVELPQEGELSGKFEVFKSEVLKSGAVTAVNQASGSFSSVSNWFWGFEWANMAPGGQDIVFNRLETTYDFVKTSGVELVAGRDFSKDFASDTAGVLLSSTAVKVMNLQSPLGTRVELNGKDLKVIGVFKDFIWDSPYQTEKPMVINFNRQKGFTINMRLNPANSLSRNVELISAVAKRLNPAYPVDIKFVDNLYAQKLQSEKILGILANLFGGIAIFISCMGLYGLVAYSAEQRTKEFGVRRILGASVSSIMNLLSVSFLKMVFVAACIGVPLAYYLMNRWLTNFEFRTSISFQVILTSIVGTAAIAFLTVGFQAYKAARANPAEALKYEQ